MFYELIEQLTPKQRKDLEARGIASTRVSEWRARKMLPGRTHTAALSEVTGADLDELNRDLTLLEIERDAQRNPAFQPLAISFRASWHST